MDESRLEALAEYPVRRTLEIGIQEQDASGLSEDEAYDIAEDLVRDDRFLTEAVDPAERPVNQRTLRELRSAYQQVVAARLLGVDTVGASLIEESVVTLGWASEDAAPEVTDYLHALFQPVSDTLARLGEATFLEIKNTAKTAARIRQAASLTPAIVSPFFSWIPRARSEYTHRLMLHIALLSDEVVRERAEVVVNSSDFRSGYYDILGLSQRQKR
ncbi:hypothetical protein ACFQZ8_03795 [Micromonospora azadirachtae]|uniref:Uncharacterized protein n=1 Tax=Micromonospora azadirachtae TaxID=1970735 RepID=A0ABW2ZWW0_9ACTN